MLAHLDGPPAQHSMLSVVDAASWRQLGPGMADVLDGYELAGAVPVGDSGSEFIAGSVKLSGAAHAAAAGGGKGVARWEAWLLALIAGQAGKQGR